MFGIYLKIARRNVVRQFRDYSVYFLTLALASCLLYSFTASGDYLLALDLTEQQRGIYGATSSVMQAFSVFSVLVFLFLVVYANRFILRRRSREFALYGLLGLSSSRTMRILIYESCMVGLVALVVGVGAGVLLSPVFGGVAAFVFAVPWSFVITCSADAALWTAGCFVVIMAGALLLGARDLRKRTLLQLMTAESTPENRVEQARFRSAFRESWLVSCSFLFGECALCSRSPSLCTFFH